MDWNITHGNLKLIYIANAPDLIGEYWQRFGRAAGVGATGTKATFR
jgi:hypothetical protein